MVFIAIGECAARKQTQCGKGCNSLKHLRPYYFLMSDCIDKL
ncbi:Uncharacterised protein [Vibrio cholerae]|nr:Uncharacterised protein [Vibrio cholerae]